MIVMPADNTGILVGWLAGRFEGRIGHLYSPRPRKNTGPFSFAPYALDNGAYAAGDNWTDGLWRKLLDWARLSGQRPRWVLVPDVVGDRNRTLERWDRYAPQAAAYGWPLAFAVQDGMTRTDVPPDAEVVFVGGSTKWKWRTVTMWCQAFPRVHVGRVNSYRRLWQCHEAGAESCDGTGWFRGDHGSGRPLRALVAYLEESSGRRDRVRQMELIA